MSFRFEQHWAKLGKFSMGLDHLHDEEGGADGSDFVGRQSTIIGLPGGSPLGAPGRRSLMQNSGRRGSSQGELGSQRSSAVDVRSGRGSLAGAAGNGLPLGNERVFAATQMGSTEMLPPLPSARSVQGQPAISGALAAAAAAATAAASSGPESARTRRRTVAFNSNQ